MKVVRWLKLKRVWVPLAVLVVVIIVVSFVRGADESKSMAYSDVMNAAQDGRLESIDVRGTRLDVRLRGDATKYSAEVGSSTDVARSLRDAVSSTQPPKPDVDLRFHRATGSWDAWTGLLIQLAASGLVVYVAMRLALRHTQRP